MRPLNQTGLSIAAMRCFVKWDARSISGMHSDLDGNVPLGRLFTSCFRIGDRRARIRSR